MKDDRIESSLPRKTIPATQSPSGSSPDLERYQSMIAQAPVPIGLLEGPDLIIRKANDLLLDVWGKSHDIIGLPLTTGLPEAIERQSDVRLREVLTTGIPFVGKAGRISRIVNGVQKDRYYDFTFSPLTNPGQPISHVLIMATDVTDRYVAEEEIKASESRLKDVILSAPAAMGLFLGRDLIIDNPNQEFISVVGKGPDIAGKPLREVLPELESQPFLKILDDVFTTGKTHRSFNSPVDINIDGDMIRHYYNVAFSPLFNSAGQVYAVLDISIEVTGEVMARNQLEETETLLRNAIDIAMLGVWTIDIEAGRMLGNSQMAAWLGFDPAEETLIDVYKTLEPEGRERLHKAIEFSLDPSHSEIYDEEFSVRNRQNHRTRILKIRGKTTFNNSRKPVRIMGTARDITNEKKMSQELELQIQERTEALGASLEELKATNEDLAVTNENLKHSNEDLQRFAHVASHDLKEPIRKIKTFLGMIALEKGKPVDEAMLKYIERVNAAADRMFDMINGVLKFSTVNSNHEAIEEVKLNDVIRSVLQDLELIINRQEARIATDKLPTIEGAAILLHQLFYNLLANALKFVVKDRKPMISLTCGEAMISAIPCVQISIKDNGIGFNNKFAESIFDSFTRLNAKDSFEGTGLGLSLCKRIVERHHGSITAAAIPNEGATFIILLPKKQSQPFI